MRLCAIFDEIFAYSKKKPYLCSRKQKQRHTMTKKKNGSASPEIKFDAHNFRFHNRENKKMIHDSLSELGAGRSIVMDNENELIAGNGVYEQAQKLGMPVRIVETDGTELVVVKRTDLATDDLKRKKLAAADNAISDHVEWNAEELRLSGLDAATIEALHIDLPEIGGGIEENEAQEDNFDEEAQEIETRCQPCDLWQLGNHRLLCGDSTKAEDVRRLMDGERADLWLTDPPYNVAIKNSKGMTIANDNTSSAEFLHFLTNAFKASEPTLKAGAAFYVWFASREHINFENALTAAGLNVRQELIWNKNAFILGRSDYHYKHEPCLYGWKEGAPHYFCGLRNEATVLADEVEMNPRKMRKDELVRIVEEMMASKEETTILNENKPTRDAEHPTIKPVRLFGRLIRNSSRKGDIVLDTFGGSGTTMVACEQMGRKARLMELDPHFCDVILTRWENLTGQTAIRL